MEVDIYAPCPCGSGKKMKFCCADILPEMEPIMRLRASRQTHAALQAVEKLEPKYPKNPWLLSVKSSLLAEEGRNDEARATVTRLREVDPEHPVGMLMDAVLTAQGEGLDAAQEKIDLALQQGRDKNPDAVATLAMTVGTMHASKGHVMALHRYLELALGLARDGERQGEILEELAELDSTRSIPYPFRTSYQLIVLPPKGQKALAPAYQWADEGLFGKAGKMYRQAADKIPQEYSLWRNSGICCAWAGDEKTAAEYLHKAAETDSNVDRAVESEVLAQLLDYNQPEFRTEIRGRKFEVRSVSKLLSQLDQQEGFARLPTPAYPEGDPRRNLVGVYEILDRAVPTGGVTAENIPQVLAQFTIANEGDGKARGVLVPMSPEKLNDLMQKVRAAGGEELGPDEETDVVDSYPSDLGMFHWRWHFPRDISPGLQRRLTRDHWDRTVQETWVNSPQKTLGGKTPLEVAGNPEYRVRLGAALNVLEAMCEPQYPVDVSTLRHKLQLTEPAPLEITPETDVTALSILDLRRVPLEKLSQEQLLTVLNRAGSMEHYDFLYKVLKGAVSRPENLTAETPVGELYRTLADLCHQNMNKEEALQWIAKGREETKNLPRAYELKIMWDLKELVVRLDDPEDKQAIPLVRQIMENYGKKIPGLSEQLQQLVASYKLEMPFMSQIVTADAAPALAGGVWTPGAAEPAGGGTQGGSGLWLPGQD
ncbi:MAG: hypothetical protein U0903_21770 [Planctomycetales bacterium]